MKPCIVCGKSLSKKDSVYTYLYVCSDACKKTHRANLPKKITTTTVEYWIRRGFDEEASREIISAIQRGRSPRCVDYWMKRGFNYADSAVKVSEIQKQNSSYNLTKFTKEQRQQRSPFSTKYWVSRGFTEDEAKHIVSANSATVSLEAFVERYGELGQSLYQNFCNKRKRDYTLQGYIKKYGQEMGESIWSKKFKNRHNSVRADHFFKELASFLQLNPDEYYCASNNGEYGVFDKENNKYYFYDFVCPKYKLCIEYFGDYWHCNPTKYGADYVHQQSGYLATDIWKNDAVKLQTITKERGFDTMVVWESEAVSDEQAIFQSVLLKVNTMNLIGDKLC